MDLVDVFVVPKRPTLEFGKQLDFVCDGEEYHSGLKDLFLKAYLNAKDDDFDEQSDLDVEHRVLLALKPGSEGQGTLSQRLSLKSRLESGEWILAAQTPPGAPLWLLRHFLGRLPRPLLEGSEWRELGKACGESSWPFRQVLRRIAAAAGQLARPGLETLGLLSLLLGRLSLGRRGFQHEDALDSLTRYFLPALVSRPFRPGLYTASDLERRPLLNFLVQHWHDVFPALLQRPDRAKPQPGLRPIGFEPLLLGETSVDDTGDEASPRISLGRTSSDGDFLLDSEVDSSCEIYADRRVESDDFGLGRSLAAAIKSKSAGSSADDDCAVETTVKARTTASLADNTLSKTKSKSKTYFHDDGIADKCSSAESVFFTARDSH